MLRFFLRLSHLFKTLAKGLREDPDFAALGFLLGVLIATGTTFYRFAEGWSLVDGFYFCVMTMATVGYGDLHPTTTLSKLFTVGFTFLGIGLFASFVARIAVITMEHRRGNR